jgi:HPt (histidine-containing phosphotransfer) domain-containing protein
MFAASGGENQPVKTSSGEQDWHFDLHKALELVEDEEDLLRAVVEVFVEESPRLVQNAEDAQRAGDQAQLQFAAHTLKTSFNSLCLEQMRQLSERIETLAAAGQLQETSDQVRKLRCQTDTIITELNDYLAQG